MTSADSERLACRASCEAVKCQLRSFRTHLWLEEALILGTHGHKQIDQQARRQEWHALLQDCRHPRVLHTLHALWYKLLAVGDSSHEQQHLAGDLRRLAGSQLVA